MLFSGFANKKNREIKEKGRQKCYQFSNPELNLCVCNAAHDQYTHGSVLLSGSHTFCPQVQSLERKQFHFLHSVKLPCFFVECLLDLVKMNG